MLWRAGQKALGRRLNPGVGTLNLDTPSLYCLAQIAETIVAAKRRPTGMPRCAVQGFHSLCPRLFHSPRPGLQNGDKVHIKSPHRKKEKSIEKRKGVGRFWSHRMLGTFGEQGLFSPLSTPDSSTIYERDHIPASRCPSPFFLRLLWACGLAGRCLYKLSGEQGSHTPCNLLTHSQNAPELCKLCFEY